MAKLNLTEFSKQMKCALDHFNTWDSIKQSIITKIIFMMEIRNLSKIHPIVLISGEDVSINTIGNISDIIYVHLYAFNYTHYVIKFNQDLLDEIQEYSYDLEFDWIEYINKSTVVDGFTETVLVLKT